MVNPHYLKRALQEIPPEDRDSISSIHYALLEGLPLDARSVPLAHLVQALAILSRTLDFDCFNEPEKDRKLTLTILAAAELLAEQPLPDPSMARSLFINTINMPSSEELREHSREILFPIADLGTKVEILYDIVEQIRDYYKVYAHNGTSEEDLQNYLEEEVPTVLKRFLVNRDGSPFTKEQVLRSSIEFFIVGDRIIAEVNPATPDNIPPGLDGGP